MNATLERCLSFVSSQSATGADSGRLVRRAVTISRQAGCGAVQVAEKLTGFLQENSPPRAARWMVFDRNLMSKVLEDHKLPAHLEKFLPEDRISAAEDILADIFDVHPPVHKMVTQTAETLFRLAELGNVILIGRAGNIVTAKIPHVLHVRLVAPLAERVERICQADKKTPGEARRFCLEEEQARARYVKTYFNADIDDPLRYHLVLNTGLLGCEGAARVIAGAVRNLD